MDNKLAMKKKEFVAEVTGSIISHSIPFGDIQGNAMCFSLIKEFYDLVECCDSVESFNAVSASIVKGILKFVDAGHNNFMDLLPFIEVAKNIQNFK